MTGSFISRHIANIEILCVMCIIILTVAVPSTDPYKDPIISIPKEQEDRVYQEEVTRAMKHAPPGKSIFQLRGDVQKNVEQLLQKAIKLYDIPIYGISAIRWNLKSETAGTATQCSSGPPYQITINELLFLHNYSETMTQIIPHEVAHIIVCFIHPEVSQKPGFDTHGEEWKSVVRDLGGTPNEFHGLSTTPITLYKTRIDVLVLTFLVESQ